MPEQLPHSTDISSPKEVLTPTTSVQTQQIDHVAPNPVSTDRGIPQKRLSLQFKLLGLFVVLIFFVGIVVFQTLSKNQQSTTSVQPAQENTQQFTQDVPIDAVLSVVNQENTTKPEQKKSLPIPKRKIQDEIYTVGNAKGSRIQDVRLQLNTQNKQSSLFSVHAAETDTIPLYPLMFGNYSKEAAQSLARSFGIQTEPKTFDQYDKMLFSVLATDSGMVVGAGRGGYTYYKKATELGNAPDETAAKEAATSFLYQHGFTNKTVEIVNTRKVIFQNDEKPEARKNIHGEIPLDLNYRDQWGWVITFQTNLDGTPVIDLNEIMFDRSMGFISVAVGPHAEILSMTNSMDAYSFDKEHPLLMRRKSLDEAASEVTQTGGLVLRMTPKIPPQQHSPLSRSLPGNIEGFEVSNAVITKASLIYYLSSNSGFKYTSDINKYKSGYLIPVWIFEGTGTISRGMLGNLDYSGLETGFTTAVYAFAEPKPVVAEIQTSPSPTPTTPDPIIPAPESRVFSITQLTSSADVVATNSAITTSFSFGYTENESPVKFAVAPERGLKYTITVIYPNGDYMQKTDIVRFSGYGEKFVIPTKDAIGTIRVIYTLTDFPSTSVEQDFTVEPIASQAEGALLVYISDTHYKSLQGFTVKAKHLQIPNIEKEAIAGQDPEHPDIPSSTAALFKNMPVGAYSLDVFDLNQAFWASGSGIVTSPRQSSPGGEYKYDYASVWKQL